MNGNDVAVYSPGSWVALAGARSWLLIDIDASNPTIDGCWILLRNEAPLDAILSEIVRTGLNTVRSFALLGFFRATVRVVVRGDAEAHLSGVEGRRESVSARSAATWVERTLSADVGDIELVGSEDVGSIYLPLAAGVTMAAAIRVTILDGSARAPTRRSSSEAVQPHLEGSEPARPSSHPTDVPVGDLTPGGDLGGGRARYLEMLAATQRPRDALNVEATVTGTSTGVAKASTSFVPGRVEEHTLAPTDDEYPTGPLELSGPTDALPLGIDPSHKSPNPLNGDSGAAIVAAPTDDGPADAREVLAAQTVNRALIAAMEMGDGPTVLAARCTAGHLSPADASLCRLCQTPIPPQHPFLAARPVLGALRFSNGDEVALDCGVVMGRAPIVSEVGDRQSLHVVRLASSDEISRTHLEVRLEGWHVIVADLGSTNGTVVSAPGHRPVALREGDALVIEFGTTISLTDEVSFEFQPPA